MLINDTSHWGIYQFAKTLAISSSQMIKEEMSESESKDGAKRKSIGYECKLSPSDLVTMVDKKVEQYIKERICEKYPEHSFVGEESSASAGIPANGYCWVIDPIDGTNNFVHGNTSFCVSIGVCWNGLPVIGCVFRPSTGDLYHAMAGKGAYLNDSPLERDNDKNLKESLVIVEFTGKEDDLTRKDMGCLLKESHGIRILGSSALDLCMLATNSYDVFLVRGIKSWDICAGVCILKEAGGDIENLRSSETDFTLVNGDYIASKNPKTIKEVRDLLFLC